MPLPKLSPGSRKLNPAALNLTEHLEDRNYAGWQAAWDNYECACSIERSKHADRMVSGEMPGRA